MSHNPIDPGHYAWMREAIGVEPKDIAGLFGYHTGTAMVYLMRAGRKRENGESQDEAAIRDLKKAARHIEFELERLQRGRSRGCLSTAGFAAPPQAVDA